MPEIRHHSTHPPSGKNVSVCVGAPVLSGRVCVCVCVPVRGGGSEEICATGAFPERVAAAVRIFCLV